MGQRPLRGEPQRLGSATSPVALGFRPGPRMCCSLSLAFSFMASRVEASAQRSLKAVARASRSLSRQQTLLVHSLFRVVPNSKQLLSPSKTSLSVSQSPGHQGSSLVRSTSAVCP